MLPDANWRDCEEHFLATSAFTDDAMSKIIAYLLDAENAL